jgi:ATP-dependent DNA helicase RecG
MILEFAEAEGAVTNADVRERTGLGRTDALRLLTELVDEGQLEIRGERRGAHYVIPDGGLSLS